MSAYAGERDVLFIRIPTSLKRRMYAVAAAKGLTINALVIRCLEAAIDPIQKATAQ